MSRIMLTGPTTFYIATTGNDTTGDGSSGNPWATPGGACDRLLVGYDLAGQVCTLQLADGTYTSSTQLFGMLVGQRSADHLLIKGNYSNPYACIIRPTSGYAFSVDKGAQCTIGGVYMDMLGADGLATGQDTTAVGPYSIMVWDDKLVFGPNVNPWNHCSVNGTLLINGGPSGSPKGYTIAPGLQYRTWSASGPTTWLTVASLTKIRLYQGVNGPYQHPLAHVIGIDVPNSRVQISHATSNTGAVANMGVNFSNGAQCHILTGVGGRCQFVTNAEPNRGAVTLNHGSFYYHSFLCAYQLSVINYPANIAFSGWCTGKRYDVSRNSVIDVEGAGLGLTATQTEEALPGSAAGTKATGGIYV